MLFVVLRVLMFFLVGSVFYQGSIFSSLIITLPPILPSTLESLVDSQIQIITTTRVYDSGYRSMLTNFLIDDVINTTKPGSNLFHTLTQVKKRTKFIDSSSSFAVGLSISESLRVKFGSGEVNKVSDTFAVINAENELVEMLSAIGLMGDVHVVRSLEAPIFFINNPICIGGKMLLPLISIGFGQLAQSGLYERWEELENLKILIAQVKALKNRDLYRKAVISRLFRVRKKIVFEEEEAVSISALEGFLVLVMILFGVALVIFLVEWRRSVFRFVEVCRCISCNTKEKIQGAKNWKNGQKICII